MAEKREDEGLADASQPGRDRHQRGASRPASMTTGWAARTTSRPTGRRPSGCSRPRPGCGARVRANRAFLVRAVRYLAAEAGIRQFLDIGTGIPSANNTHEVAQRGRAGLADRLRGQRPDRAGARPRAAGQRPGGGHPVHARRRQEPGADPQAAAQTLDFTRPAALMLLGMLHLIQDAEDPYADRGRADGRAAVRQLPGHLPSGQ